MKKSLPYGKNNTLPCFVNGKISGGRSGRTMDDGGWTRDVKVRKRDEGRETDRR